MPKRKATNGDSETNDRRIPQGTMVFGIGDERLYLWRGEEKQKEWVHAYGSAAKKAFALLAPSLSDTLASNPKCKAREGRNVHLPEVLVRTGPANVEIQLRTEAGKPRRITAAHLSEKEMETLWTVWGMSGKPVNVEEFHQTWLDARVPQEA